jgi:hypothetical protein
MVPRRRYADLDFFAAILAGYWIAFLVLLVGGFAQMRIGDLRNSIMTWVFAAVCFASASQSYIQLAR